jgi:hypothetical protein
MKTLKVIMLMILGLAVASCNDDDDNRTNKLSSEEQAELVASAMGESGFAAASEQTADQADDASGSGSRVAECGYTDDGSVNLSGTIGSISFSYLFAYDVELNCNGDDEPSSFNSEFTYAGSFESNRLDAEYEGDGSLTVTQLDDEENYEFDGSYNREGSFEAKVGKESSGSSDIEIDVNNVMVRKSDKKIVDGSADVSIKGTVSGKGSYSFNAEVDFHSDGTATIHVDGDTYIMVMATGQVTKQEND